MLSRITVQTFLLVHTSIFNLRSAPYYSSAHPVLPASQEACSHPGQPSKTPTSQILHLLSPQQGQQLWDLIQWDQSSIFLLVYISAFNLILEPHFNAYSSTCFLGGLCTPRTASSIFRSIPLSAIEDPHSTPQVQLFQPLESLLPPGTTSSRHLLFPGPPGLPVPETTR